MNNLLSSDHMLSAENFAKYVLTVRDGIHAGAHAEIFGGSLLVIGAADDCDLILVDEGVMPHHCVIGQLGSSIFIKSLQATLVVDDRLLMMGEQRTLYGEGKILIGSVSIVICSDQVSFFSLKSLIPVWWSRVLVILLFTMLLTGFAWTFVDFLNLPGPRLPAVPTDTHNSGQQDGLIENSGNGVKDFDPVSADDKALARQVSEVFRLSGLSVKTVPVGEGVVEVSGMLADLSDAESVIKSRALNDIKGLRQVRVINTASGKEANRSERRIVRLTSGLEPYFVTANGARYYLGARLTSGDTVIAIQKEHIRLVSDDGKERVISAGAILE